MLEAKTSAPHPENIEDFDKYIREIQEKFQNSISLINAAWLKRRKDIHHEMPQPLQDVDFKSNSYFLYLVLKESKDDWIVNLTLVFRQQLHPFLKCWNIPDENFFVLSEKMAREKNIVE